MRAVATVDTCAFRVGLRIPPADSGDTVVRIDSDTLAEALETECRLLASLCVILRRQRSSREDSSTLEESLVAMHRVTRTLDEARRHRRTILGLLTATEDTALETLADALGPKMTGHLAAVRNRFLDLTRRVAREIEVNRLVFTAWSRR